MNKNYSDDYLRKVFQQKLQNFEPELTDQLKYSWPRGYSSKSGTKRKLLVSGCLIFFLLVITEQSDRQHLPLSTFPNLVPEISPQGIKQQDDNLKENKLPKQSIHSREPIPLQADKIHPNAHLQKAHTASRSEWRGVSRQEKKILDRPVDSWEIPVNDLKRTPEIIDSLIVTINNKKSMTLSDKNRTEQTRPFVVSIGVFVNTNHFAPVKGDGHFIRGFNQHKNPLRNRIGWEAAFRYKAVRIPLFSSIAIQPTLKYQVLHKSYSFESQSVLPEHNRNLVTISENQAYHFLGVGVNLSQPVFNRQVIIESVFIRRLNHSGYSFASKYVEFGLSTDMRFKNDATSSFTITPFINYAIPISQSTLFSMNMANIGMRIHVL